MLFVWMTMGAAVAGSTLNVETMSMDGLELRELSCELEKAPMLGAIVVAGALAAQKDALTACGPDGQAFRVQWTWAAVTTATVTASSLPDTDSCVTEAIGKVPPALPGKCTAVILTGPVEVAEAARSKLVTPTE